MRLMLSLEDLGGGPVGRAIAGNSFLAWCATPRLSGTVHFGRRDTSDAATLLRLYDFVTHPSLRPPLRRVIDGRAFNGIDEDAWAQMIAEVRAKTGPLRNAFERQAVIVTDGVEGARNSALLPALGPGDSFRVFTDPVAAYEYADAVDGRAAMVEVDELVASIASGRLVESRVRAWLVGNLRTADMEACATSLGLSSRTLQRQLADLGTSYRSLVTAARVAAARALLEDGDAKVDAVATAVGYASASQLGVILRAAGLASPAALRSSARRARRG